MKQIILPSVMAKDQTELDALLNKLTGVAKILQLDVVDGKFAPNLSLDFNFKLSKNFKYYVHLLVKDPLKYVKKHPEIELFFSPFESFKDPAKYIKEMKLRKKKIGFSINPETSVSKIKNFLPFADYVIVLTVHPGFYGGKFLPAILKKITAIKRINHKIKIIVDGGIDLSNIKAAKKAGADYLVSGHFVTQAPDPKKALKELTLTASSS